MAKYEALFTPFKIGNCEIRNRVIIPAMEGTNIVENMYGPHYNEKAWDYYIERSQNEVGLFIPGMSPVIKLMKIMFPVPVNGSVEVHKTAGSAHGSILVTARAHEKIDHAGIQQFFISKMPILHDPVISKLHDITVKRSDLLIRTQLLPGS